MFNIVKQKYILPMLIATPMLLQAADPCLPVNGKKDVGGQRSGDNILVLLNREGGNQLARSWMPDDLVKVPNGKSADKKNYTSPQSGRVETLRADVLEAFMQMADDAKKDNLTLSIYSGFRSYDEQCGAYYGKIKKRGDEAVSYKLPRTAGEDFAKKSSAPPGRSQHQLGTTFDMGFGDIPQFSLKMDQSKEYAWLQKNAHKYGFILSYPKAVYKTEENTNAQAEAEQNKVMVDLVRYALRDATKYNNYTDDQLIQMMKTDPILKKVKDWYSDYNPKTGYFYEAWHWRYVGTEIATDIKQENEIPDVYLKELEKKSHNLLK